ncbi:DUF4190 domain-containing protein [Pilimelia columellifera]|uniref:DUF4190 domain-containing protein n=1 Tax=Pilimelia columellifera subsp. columellifera TaxID=706583 RepID=A0ABN3NGR2_9ACTN
MSQPDKPTGWDQPEPGALPGPPASPPWPPTAAYPDASMPAPGDSASAGPAVPDPYAQQGPYADPSHPPQGPYGQPSPYAQPSAPYGQPSPYGPPGYPGGAAPYGYLPQYPPRPNNSMAIAALIVSATGVIALSCSGVGGLLGAVGAILGHVSSRQIQERGEDGAGVAKAAIIVGWIAAALGVLATLAIIGLLVVSSTSSGGSTYSGDYDAMFAVFGADG